MSSLFSDLEPFLGVAEHGSFRRAAEALGVTPPAISKAIARLETRLGTPLLTRTTRRVALTAEGEAFLEKCRAAAREIEAGQDQLARSQRGGRLTLTAPFILGRFLAARLPQFMDRHPEASVRLTMTDRRIDLMGEPVDVAIRVGEPGEDDLVARRLAGLEWVMVAAPDYLRRHGTPRSVGDLAGHRCLVFVPPSGQAVPWRVAEGGRRHDLPVRADLEVDEGELLVDAAIGGGGIAQVFTFMVADALREGRLVAVLDGMQARAPDLNAVMAPGRSTNLRVRLLLDFLYGCFRTL